MKWTNVEIEKIKKLIQEGKNYAQIGELLNKTRDSIRYVANKHNLKFEVFNPKPYLQCKSDEKYCTICKGIKQKNEFNKNKNRKDGLNNICKECSRKRSKKYYEENIELHKQNTRERTKKYLQQLKLKILEYLKKNPCVDCGEKNPVVLEFDHRDNVEKEFSISQAISRGNSWEIVKKEIDKCDVRCANCHRIRTAKQFNWYKRLDLI